MDVRALRFSDLRFLLVLLIPALTLDAVVHHPQTAPLATALIWLTIAVVEATSPALARSPAPAAPGSPLPWLLRLYVPLQLALLAAGLHAAWLASWPTVFGIAFAVGFVTGAYGITFAHELGHGRRRADRALAWVLMGTVAYPQFMVEHYRGHHARAATHDDPATARFGESLWRFLPRTLAGNFLGAWRLEAQQLARLRRGWWTSPLAWWTAAAVAFTGLLAGAGLWKPLAFWVLQAAFAVYLLESVNYLEHYGLQRREGPDGRPEPFGAAHAWNADHAISNTLLANLQRHSDHHMHAWKPFPELGAMPEAPQLPTGYAGTILLAAVPPLWFRVMHPRLAARAAA
ncbi:alkane 1-monooxygenase [Ramlibacter sp. USB13]|uniref:Alkane 1-monooxygenase n=1 Tax=Ramlibacter cellulosilyticus TaxID=2764187 RepID=A0A923MVB2_9BURK|nr:alkane 1-monooxygenase [Ramlibacter cellulosilyticus]MBC5785309.1 alkane 1-monooxygenase [Ramlibacter cellulosilyticus]